MGSFRAHDKEAPIVCEGRPAVAVFMHGDIVCARCGEALIVEHSGKQLVDRRGRLTLVFPPEHAGAANGGAHLPPPPA